MKNGSMRLYLNGKKIGEKELKKDSAVSPADRKKLYIGRNSEAEQIAAGTYNMFSGMMDELKLYNRALSEDEITSKEAPEIAFEDI